MQTKNKRPNAQKSRKYPKGIHIEDNKGTFKFYKIWTLKRGKEVEPFLITDSLEEMTSEYNAYCERWGIKPDLKNIFKLINKHQ